MFPTLVTQCLPSVQENLAQRASYGADRSLSNDHGMPDTNFYATLKRAGLGVSPAVNAYSATIRPWA